MLSCSCCAGSPARESPCWAVSRSRRDASSSKNVMSSPLFLSPRLQCKSVHACSGGLAPRHARAKSPSCSLAQNRADRVDQPDQVALPGDRESVHSSPTGRVKRNNTQNHSEGFLRTSLAAPPLLAVQVGQQRRSGTPGCVDGEPAGN